MDEVLQTRTETAAGEGSTAVLEGPAAGAATALREHKASLRRYAPVQKGLAGLPWKGEWLCGTCGGTSPGRVVHEPEGDCIVLEHDCPRCGTWREPHTDVLFTAPKVKAHPPDAAGQEVQT